MQGIAELTHKLTLAVGAAARKKEKEAELAALDKRINSLGEELERIKGAVKQNPFYTEDWRDRLRVSRDKAKSLDIEKAAMASYEKNVKDAADKIAFEERVQVALQQLWGIVSMQGIEPLNEYLADTVSAIFGRDIEVQAEYRFKGKVREADIFIKDVGTTEFVPVELCGGSLVVIVGILLTMLFIESRRAVKLLVLDESVSELEDVALEGVMELLSSKGFTAVMASHDKRVRESDAISRTVFL